MKYQIAYSKKIQVHQYEPIGISLSLDTNTREMSMDEAYEFLVDKVHMWLQQNVDAQGVRRVVV